MTEVEALNNIASAIKYLASTVGTFNLLFLLFLIFKNCGTKVNITKEELK